MPQPVQPVSPPDRSTWTRVLRRYDRDPRLPWRLASYDLNVQARPVEMNGTVAPTVFVPPGREEAARRATRLGWRDETEAFSAWLDRELVREPEPVAGPVSGDALRQRLDGLTWAALLKLASSLVPGKTARLDGRAAVTQQIIDAAGADGLVV